MKFKDLIGKKVLMRKRYAIVDRLEEWTILDVSEKAVKVKYVESGWEGWEAIDANFSDDESTTDYIIFEVLDEKISFEADRDNMLMFFQVASEALGFDPSCQTGKLDPMCTAEAIRSLKAEREEARAILKPFAREAKSWHSSTLDTFVLRHCDDKNCVNAERTEITFGDLRRAEAFLEKTEGGLNENSND